MGIIYYLLFDRKYKVLVDYIYLNGLNMRVGRLGFMIVLFGLKKVDLIAVLKGFVVV